MDRREHLRGENATGNPRAVDYREHQRAGETRGKQEAMKINRLCIHSVLPNRMDRRIKLQLSASEQKKYWTVRSSCSLCNSIRHRRFRRCTEFHTEFCPKEDLQHPSDQIERIRKLLANGTGLWRFFLPTTAPSSIRSKHCEILDGQKIRLRHSLFFIFLLYNGLNFLNRNNVI